MLTVRPWFPEPEFMTTGRSIAHTGITSCGSPGTGPGYDIISSCGQQSLSHAGTPGLIKSLLGYGPVHGELPFQHLSHIIYVDFIGELKYGPECEPGQSMPASSFSSSLFLSPASARPSRSWCVGMMVLYGHPGIVISLYGLCSHIEVCHTLLELAAALPAATSSFVRSMSSGPTLSSTSRATSALPPTAQALRPPPCPLRPPELGTVTPLHSL